MGFVSTIGTFDVSLTHMTSMYVHVRMYTCMYVCMYYSFVLGYSM